MSAHLQKLKIKIFLAIGLDFAKTSETGHHVWGTVIYREFNTNMTILVEIES